METRMVSESRSRAARSALRIVGLVAVALSLYGFWYHATILGSDFSTEDNPPYFFHAWYTMTGISILLLLAALLSGIQLMRGRAKWVTAFIAVETLILLTFMAFSALWLHPRWGTSIAAATGISGGSLIHVLTLFVIWGPIVAIISARQIRRANGTGAGA
jgi:hypothetical protein